MSERVAAEAFPPGEYLQDELDARGWTQVEFAEIIGRPVRLVNEIIAGKRGITPETAQEIGAAFGTSAIFWLNLDAAYQLGSKAPVSPRIALRAKLRERFPVREMIKRGWIDSSSNPEVLETQILEFFRISNIDESPRLAHAAKRTDYSGPLTREQAAWLRRVQQIAETMPTAPYNEELLRERLVDLRRLTSDPEGVRHVPKVLAECGVRFVIVEPLKGSKIDGVCFWLRDDAPVIGMTLLYDRIDNFWFVLRHEVEHVLRRDGKTTVVLDVEIDSDSAGLPPEEQAANIAAAEFCVAQDKLQNWIARVKPLFSEDRLVGFAAVMETHPGIVAGQLRKRLDRWDLFTKHLVKVRHIVTRVAITDGYGHASATKA